MARQEGADAHGSAGSQGPRGRTERWYPVPEREAPAFDADKAARDADRNQQGRK